jgi:hypothetical protein
MLERVWEVTSFQMENVVSSEKSRVPGVLDGRLSLL